MRDLFEKVTLPTTIVISIFALVLSACQPARSSTPSPASTSPAPTSVPTTAAPSPSFTPSAPTPSLSPTGPARTAALSELQNEVKASTADAEWEDASEGQLIQTGGGVRTGKEARARLDISDGAIIRVAANSEFELRELSPEAADPVTRLKLSAGKLWVAVTGALGGGMFEIETPSGVATVRGSYMSVEFFDGTGQVVITCLEGQCQLTGASGKATDLTDGQQAEIPSVGKDPSPAKPMDAAQYADWAESFPEAPVPAPTPTETPSPTETITLTPIPTRTSTPFPLFTPTDTQPPTSTQPPFTSILLSPYDTTQCLPNSSPAGVVELVITLGPGLPGWPTAEEAAAAVGDSWPTITLDGQPVTVGSRGPELGPAGWAFSARTYMMLDPGEYTIISQWNWSPVYTCTLTVVSP